MRLRLEVATSATTLPWARVLAPGRGIAYDLLSRTAPDLGRELHATGWGPHGMVPFGYSPPTFPGAARRRGTYALGGKGFLEFGSPLPTVVEAWARALRERELLDWGGVALRILDLQYREPPRFASGHASLRTTSPVVLKSTHPTDQGRRWLLPTEAEYAAYFSGNLRRKAETLGLPDDVDIETITWVGARRSFAVGEGAKPGAPVGVELRGDPRTLRAIWSWGLGQANAAGFGWIGAAR